jgi:hypothetical protein
MFQSLRDAPPAVIDGQQSPAGEPAVVRPVFVDVRGHRRVWMRVSAAALAVLSIAFIAGAGLLLSERPFTAFPRLIGISEPEIDEAVTGNGTASDAPDGVGTTLAPGLPGRVPVPGAPGNNADRPGALPGPSAPPGVFGPLVPPAAPGGVQGGVGTPVPGGPITPRIDLPADGPTTPAEPEPPVGPPVEPPAEPPVVDPPPVDSPPADPPPADPPMGEASVPSPSPIVEP